MMVVVVAVVLVVAAVVDYRDGRGGVMKHECIYMGARPVWS